MWSDWHGMLNIEVCVILVQSISFFWVKQSIRFTMQLFIHSGFEFHLIWISALYYLFLKKCNDCGATLTPHNHRGSTSKGQEGPPLDCMIGPSIRCSSHSLLITIKGGIQQVKRPIPTLVRKDLQPGVIQTQILTIRKEEALQNKRKPYHMGDKTCNQVEIKPEMTPCQSTIYKTTTVLLLHHDGLFIRPQVRSIAKIKATYIHTYIQDKQFKIHH